MTQQPMPIVSLSISWIPYWSNVQMHNRLDLMQIEMQGHVCARNVFPPTDLYKFVSAYATLYGTCFCIQDSLQDVSPLTELYMERIFIYAVVQWMCFCIRKAYRIYCRIRNTSSIQYGPVWSDLFLYGSNPMQSDPWFLSRRLGSCLFLFQTPPFLTHLLLASWLFHVVQLLRSPEEQ